MQTTFATRSVNRAAAVPASRRPARAATTTRAALPQWVADIAVASGDFQQGLSKANNAASNAASNLPNLGNNLPNFGDAANKASNAANQAQNQLGGGFFGGGQLNNLGNNLPNVGQAANQASSAANQFSNNLPSIGSLTGGNWESSFGIPLAVVCFLLLVAAGNSGVGASTGEFSNASLDRDLRSQANRVGSQVSNQANRVGQKAKGVKKEAARKFF